MTTKWGQPVNAEIMPPGSGLAREDGCRCPPCENAEGKGIGGDGAQFGWWIEVHCPVHARYLENAS